MGCSSCFLLPSSILLSDQPKWTTSLNKRSNVFPCRSPAAVVPSCSKTSSISATSIAKKQHHATSATSLEVPDHGIGIADFLPNKNYFITGSTGLLGKVLVEKMLRTTPDVRKIYLLIKAESTEAAMERLEKEIIQSKLFEQVKRKLGSSYRQFMLSKLIPVVGDIGESDLGLHDNVADEIANEVDIIIHNAASTKFIDRYDDSMNINTEGPLRVLNFAKRCKNLIVFVHVSTGYVLGLRQSKGMISENPISPSITSKRAHEETIDNDGDGIQHLDIEAELNLATRCKELFAQERNVSVTEKMKELGSKRAEMFGWKSVYAFTKSMGEMLIDRNRNDIPIVIIRPTTIEGTCKEPFPGWIEGNRMLDPMCTMYGKGKLSTFIGDPQTNLNVIPVDTVINVLLAATAKHGIAKKLPGLHIYNAAAPQENPLLLEDYIRFLHKQFMASPFTNPDGSTVESYTAPLQLIGSMDQFYAHVSHIFQDKANKQTGGQNGGKNKKRSKSGIMIEKFVEMAKIYEPYMFNWTRFDCRNNSRLLEEMSDKERLEYDFDLRSVDWEDYFINIHFPGVRKHVMKEKNASS